MKKLILTAVVTMMTVSAFSQRYAYVDTEYILKNLSAYDDAQKELDRLSKQWQDEIEARYEAIDRLYKAYQAEKVLLTEEMRKEREDEIVRKEQEAKDLQRKHFGVDGDLFKKRKSLFSRSRKTYTMQSKKWLREEDSPLSLIKRINPIFFMPIPDTIKAIAY